MKSRRKRVVGNCPRCGLPIYEERGGPQKSCSCLPLGDAPPQYVTQPYPVYVPNPVYQPYTPPYWPTIISWQGNAATHIAQPATTSIARTMA